jgi:hypothetical protein
MQAKRDFRDYTQRALCTDEEVREIVTGGRLIPGTDLQDLTNLISGAREAHDVRHAGRVVGFAMAVVFADRFSGCRASTKQRSQFDDRTHEWHSAWMSRSDDGHALAARCDCWTGRGVASAESPAVGIVANRIATNPTAASAPLNRIARV